MVEVTAETLALDGQEALAATLSVGEEAPRRPEPSRIRGLTIGRYVVLSKLGVGGMGVVLAAYDPELDRKVALKLLKHDGLNAATRLQREAQALAKLGHPNVVAVYDVGTHHGQLFVAMEFIAGQTFGEWIATRSAETPWRETVRLFLAAAVGLAAAHGTGLVHRDFKPDNVMIGDDGRVRVMDFGLARVANYADEDEVEGESVRSPEESLIARSGERALASQLTQTGTLLGTPAYMAPEQFERQPADHRSDQFGFCVSLYEALYGERPFRGQTLGELMSAVCLGTIAEPPVGHRVPNWLRRVLVRGLAPKPEDRYPDMGSLIEALVDDPGARRVRRRVAGALVAALVGAGWGLWSVASDETRPCDDMASRLAGTWDGERQAEIEAGFRATGLGYAAEASDRVAAALDDYAQGWVEMRTQSCEATLAGEQSDKLLDLRMRCLDERALHLRATVDLLTEADAEVVEKAVEAVEALPSLRVCADLGALMAAVPSPDDPEVAARVQELDELVVQAQANYDVGKADAAMKLIRPVLTEAEDIGYAPLLARARIIEGFAHEHAGDYEAAEAALLGAYEHAVPLRMYEEAGRASAQLIHVAADGLGDAVKARHWARDAALFVEGLPELEATVATHIGTIDKLEGNYEAAIAHHERALAICETELDETNAHRARVLMNLGNAYALAGRLREGREYLEQALALQRSVLGPGHPEVGSSLVNLGSVLEREGKYDEAEQRLYEALRVYEAALGAEHPHVGAVLANLGNVAKVRGDYTQAIELQEQTLALFQSHYGPSHPNVLATLNNLAMVEDAQGQLDDAERHYRSALALTEELFGEHTTLVHMLNNLGGLLCKRERYTEAEPLYERALAIAKQTVGVEHELTGLTLGNLGIVAEKLGRHEQARELLTEGLRIKELILGEGHPSTGVSINALGHISFALGEPDQARVWHTRAIEIWRAGYGEDHEFVAMGLVGRGVALEALGELEAARADAERALEIHVGKPTPIAELADARFLLARLLGSAGEDPERAVELAQLARDGYAELGESGEGRVTTVDAWLARAANSPK